MIAARAKTSSIPEQPAQAGAPARILGVDYGRKRIGLALSDEMGLTARPLATLVRENRQSDVRRLREICRRHGVKRIVVGHPLHMSGEAGPMANEAARFAGRLFKELTIPVDLQDERLTSWEAKQMAAETKSSSRRKRGSIDDLAATVLLREYLERKRAEEKRG